MLEDNLQLVCNCMKQQAGQRQSEQRGSKGRLSICKYSSLWTDLVEE